ncbi:unnamed protein product, partial [Symbiodinium sp. CCMP2592]
MACVDGNQFELRREENVEDMIQVHFHGQLCLKRMPADDNCLFHALADHSGQIGQVARAEVIDFLQTAAADQGPYEETWLEEHDYLTAKSTNWGGDTAIIAFSLLRRKRIMLHWMAGAGLILSDDKTHEEVAEELGEQESEVIHLWYNGINHYDLL